MLRWQLYLYLVKGVYVSSSTHDSPLGVVWWIFSSKMCLLAAFITLAFHLSSRSLMLWPSLMSLLVATRPHTATHHFTFSSKPLLSDLNLFERQQMVAGIPYAIPGDFPYNSAAVGLTALSTVILKYMLRTNSNTWYMWTSCWRRISELKCEDMLTSPVPISTCGWKTSFGRKTFYRLRGLINGKVGDPYN